MMQDMEQKSPQTENETYAVSGETAASDASPETNFAADLEKQLGEALGEAAKLKDALLRAVADSDNIRKRAQADIAAFSVCLHPHHPTATARADQIEDQAFAIGIATRLFEVPDLDCGQHSHRSKAFFPHILPHTRGRMHWNI